jgi:glycosyltransferase involved in cell wall biosynthesis
MRILVFPASLDLGGSQLNAIEISGKVRDRGHDVMMFGPDGPLRETIEGLDLPFIAAPPRPKLRPSPSVMHALNTAVSDNRIDVVHGYEWPPIMEAVYGPHLRHGTAVTGTVMSMGVAPFIPRRLRLAVGTEQIAQSLSDRPRVHIIEPPVDTDLNQPWADVSEARRQLGAEPTDLVVVVVSRLAVELKREGILDAIAAAEELAAEMPLRLVIVGDGPARDEIGAAADKVNANAGRTVVDLVGEWNDPRPAYAGADVTFGMGSSALRAMAFAKPLIVQGEGGFFQLLTSDSLPAFLHQGWYGIGRGGDGPSRFATIVRSLYIDPARRGDLGAFARQVVVDRFSLDHAADVQEEIYRQAQVENPGRRGSARHLIRPLIDVGRYDIERRYARWRGVAETDDFNAREKQPGSGKPQGASLR